jgi:hypothetical protein
MNLGSIVGVYSAGILDTGIYLNGMDNREMKV